MHKRTYIYWASGALVTIALIGGILLLNKDSSNEPDNPNQSASQTVDPDTKAIDSKDVKTPTDNTELADTLGDDTAAIDADVKNYENGDYNDSMLSDGSLYN